MLLRKVDPGEVERDKPLIDNIARRIQEPDMYDRIREALHNRRAFLFQSEDVFTVLTPHPDYMLCWALGSHTQALNRQRQQYYLKEVERLALIGGARFLRIWSVRKGFSRILRGNGYIQFEVNHNGIGFDVWEKLL